MRGRQKLEATMLTTTVQFEAFRLGEAGMEHMLGYYYQNGELVASFMEQKPISKLWDIIEPPPELSSTPGLLREFVDYLQATTHAKALVTPSNTYR